jgi:hypothetical protein
MRDVEAHHSDLKAASLPIPFGGDRAHAALGWTPTDMLAGGMR